MVDTMNAPAGAVALSARRLTKKYQGRTAVDGVDMLVPRGAIYGLVGRNGAGKTTLLRMVAGLAAPSDGDIQLFGGEKLSEARKRLGTVIETPAVYPHLSGAENLEVMRRTIGLDDEYAVREAMLSVGLDPDDRKKSKDYSLGMRQRLVIAMALLGSPELLLLDEPMNGLDPMGIAMMRETIERINRERSLTVVISSHLISELERVATCYGVLEAGKLVREFRPGDIDGGSGASVTLRTSNSLRAGELIRAANDQLELEYLPGDALRVSVPDGYDRDAVAARLVRAISAGEVDIYGVSSGAAQNGLENYILSIMGGGNNA